MPRYFSPPQLRHGNPPAAANVVVPDTGTVRYDFALVLR